MYNILIINSPLFKDKNSQSTEDYLPPIGLGYIATNLKMDDVKLIFHDAVAKNSTLLELLQLTHDIKPKYICINIFTTNYNIVKEFVESISEREIYIIIGGLSTKFLYDRIVEWNTPNHLDIVIGDGEFICKAIINNKVFENPIFSNTNRRVFKVGKDSKYFANDISKCKLDRAFFEYEPANNVFGELEANIVTSRGCVNNCAYCIAARSINSDYSIREKSTENIIYEISNLEKIYINLKYIRILDDLFLKNKSSIEKAINIFDKFDLKWRSMAHVQTFNGVKDELIIKMLKSGCTELFIGIDSGSSKILKMINKTSDIERIKTNVTILLKNGIAVKGYFIYGFPDETEEDFIRTYELAEYLKQKSINFNTSFRTSVFQFRPYHGTKLYKYLVDKNKYNMNNIKSNDELSNMIGKIQYNFYSDNYSSEEENKVYEYINKTKNLNNL